MTGVAIGLIVAWSVVDGVIAGKNTEPVPVSTYLLTKRKFSDFRITAKGKLEWLTRFVSGDKNPGTTYHPTTAPRIPICS